MPSALAIAEFVLTDTLELYHEQQQATDGLLFIVVLCARAYGHGFQFTFSLGLGIDRVPCYVAQPGIELWAILTSHSSELGL